MRSLDISVGELNPPNRLSVIALAKLSNAVKIREFQLGDERPLHAVYHSAIHEIASKDYTAEQIEAWAPASLGLEAVWTNKMREIRPFVVEDDRGRIVAYADVQSHGYIDHFFVSGAHARKGVGTMLMKRIHAVANDQNILLLTSHVSRTAQPFFQKFGFSMIEVRSPVVRGVVVPNALMRKELG